MSASNLVEVMPIKINFDNVSALIRLTDIKPSTNDLPQIKSLHHTIWKYVPPFWPIKKECLQNSVAASSVFSIITVE